MVNTKTNLKHRLMAVRFAIWDLHLYLDTHPTDNAALSLINDYNAQYKSLLCDYENKYGCLSSESCCGENWISKPFPWDNMGSDC